MRHTTEELAPFTDVIQQLDWRRELILDALRERGLSLDELSAVIGRGGLIRPIPAGVYEVNERMRYDLRHAPMKHACNLGGLLA
ncbi:MAG: butyrate kinase, partial [Alistipes sp.]|nr:butyrate kinase [Alistipes sp.]